MAEELKRIDPAIILHWTYTREEWQLFQRWKQWRRGLFHYIVHRVRGQRSDRVPEVTITPGKVWINEVHEPFHDGERRFRAIHIRDAGKLNVMEISYDHRERVSEIRIPIPKGKLREAIALQDRLTNARLQVV